MSKQPISPQRAREQALFRYWNALERGDFKTVAAISKLAERDPILDRMISEMHELEETPLTREKIAPTASKPQRGISIVHLKREPSTDSWPPKPDHLEEDSDMNATYSDTIRRGNHRLQFVTAFAAALILIVFGLLVIDMAGDPFGGLPIFGAQATEVPTCADSTKIDVNAESVRLAGEAVALLDANTPTPEVIEQAGLLALCALQTSHTTEADLALQQVMGMDGSVQTFTGNGDSAAFSPDGQYLLTGENAVLRLWDVATGEQLREFIGHTEYVTALTFSPDGRYILSGSADKTVRMWDVETGEEIRQFVGHTDLIQMGTVAFSPDGRYIITGSDDTTVRLWDIETGEEIRRFTGHRMPVFGAAFSPDGRYVATSSWDTTVRLWDAATGDELRQYPRHNSWAAQIAFSSDGRYLLNSGPFVVRLSDVETGETIREYQAQLSRALEFPSFSPDGRYVLASDRDNKLALLWDAETGELVRTFDGRVFDPDAWRMYDVRFSPDGHAIAIAMAGVNNLPHLIWLWDTDYHDTIARACSTVTRDFTPDERAQYGLGEGAPCPAV